MTTTPDGGLLFVAEAGAMAVIDADLPSSYAAPLKLEKISSRGVRAVELVLDPQADPGSPLDRKTVVYVAGGRQGLWLMQADPNAGQPMPAARIDDAAVITSPTVADNVRWCNDVDVFQHGETRYLVALFAKWGCTHVRFYPLEAARNVLANHPGQETGHELQAALEVKFGGNCTFQTPRWESFGLGLTVDDTDPNQTFVYVAMGPYGLVRIRLLDTTDITVRQVNDGPWFGTGSFYANTITAPTYALGGVYDDFEVKSGTPPLTHRRHAPFFCDVDIQYAGSSKYLWCAVDHLGILRFDVTNPSAWSTTMPIDHQEGKKRTAGDLPDWPGFDETLADAHIRLVAENADTTIGEPASVRLRNYAHRIRIANDANPPGLTVAVKESLFVLSDSILNEGRTLAHLGHSGDGIPPNQSPPPFTEGAHDYTLVYNLATLVPKPPANAATVPAYQHVALLREGGQQVNLPVQHPSGQLVLFGGRFTPPRKLPFLEDAETGGDNDTFRALYDWPAATLNGSLLRRLALHRPGRLCYDISFSAVNPSLFYFGSNDAHVRPDGFLATCGSQIVRIDYQPEPTGSDARATFGVLHHPYAIWPGVPGRDYVWGVAKPPGMGMEPHWMLVDMDPGTNICDPTLAVLPRRVKQLYVQSPADNFGADGRGYFSGGEMSLLYDTHVAPNLPLLFGSRFDTPAGVVVLDRAVIQNNITTQPDEHILGATVATHRELLTHPEFRNVYDTTLNPTIPVPQNWLGPTTTLNPTGTGLVGRVNTSFPRLLEANAPSGPKRWVLAVPCAAVQLPIDLPTFTDPTHPQYLPPPHPWLPDAVYRTSYDRAMVRVFDVNNWLATVDPLATLPEYTLLGPRPEGAATRIEPLTWNDRDYLFVTDYGGSLMVWEVTNLLQQPAGRVVAPGDTDYASFMIQEWVAPLSVSDDITNNTWSVALDRATWTDAGGQRDEVYVYVLVGRVGIEVLRFLPSAAPGQRLQSVGRIETPYGQGRCAHGRARATRQSAGCSLRTVWPGSECSRTLNDRREAAMSGKATSDGRMRALADPSWKTADGRRTAVCAAFLTGALLAGWTRTTSAQEILVQIDGGIGEWLGPAASLGDLDGDGTEDFVLGAPGGAKVYVYSGSTLDVLFEVDTDGQCCDGFGRTLSGTGDFDGDGVSDFVAGDKHEDAVIYNGGAVHVLSGVDGSPLAEIYGDMQSEGLGYSVAGLGDIDGDGFADVAAGPETTNHVRIYGGPDGHLIRSHFGPTITRPSIAGVGDMDGDGRPDYVIGWPQDTTIGDWAGRATVYSGIDGSVIHDVFGQTGNGTGIIGDHLGTSVAGLGDVDGDGIPDFAAGAPGVVCLGSCGGATQARVRVYSGLDGRVLHEWSGAEETDSPAGGAFGFHILGGGDFNGDGHGDILVAAPYDGPGIKGSIQAFSGRTGEKLWKVYGEGVSGNRLRFGAILGDLNGDGLAEFAVGDDLIWDGGSFSSRVTIYEGFPADAVEHCFTAPTSGSRGIQLDPIGPIGIGNNELRLVATEAAAGQPALFFYGTVRPPMPFGDGWLCTAPPMFRLSPPGTVELDGFIERTLDFSQLPISSGPGQISAGSTWSFQLFCRDPAGPGGSGFNLSDGLLITFPP